MNRQRCDMHGMERGVPSLSILPICTASGSSIPPSDSFTPSSDSKPPFLYARCRYVRTVEGRIPNRSAMSAEGNPSKASSKQRRSRSVSASNAAGRSRRGAAGLSFARLLAGSSSSAARRHFAAFAASITKAALSSSAAMQYGSAFHGEGRHAWEMRAQAAIPSATEPTTRTPGWRRASSSWAPVYDHADSEEAARYPSAAIPTTEAAFNTAGRM